MEAFTHSSARLKVHFGEPSLGRLARDLDAAGLSRAVIVTGPTLAAGGAVLDAVLEALGPRVAGVHPGARPHSPVPAVLETAEVLSDLGADAVVALGGGSAVVTARAAAIALAEGRDLRPLATTRDGAGRLHSPRLMAPKLPQFVIPTTPATAMVKAGSAVLDPETGDRLALYDPKTRAISVALHPVMLMSAPEQLVIDVGLSLLMLSIEGVLSGKRDPFGEALLLQALRLAGPVLEHGDLNGLPARADLALAAALAGRGTDHSGGGIAGVLGHALGPRLHLPNGRINAVVLPGVLRFNAEAAAGRIGLVAGLLGAPAPGVEGLIEIVARIRERLGVPSRLRDLGISHELLAEGARAGLSDWSLLGNPRPVTREEELLTLLDGAW